MSNTIPGFYELNTCQVSVRQAREGRVEDLLRRGPMRIVGNVLGSRGSVISLFQQQIAAGGPATATHPQMQRDFTTIPEADQLIVEVALVGQSGEVSVLDMGELVRVVDLATDLIRLSGLVPGRDIEIAFTGPYPAERLSETLFAGGEVPRRTRQRKMRS